MDDTEQPISDVTSRVTVTYVVLMGSAKVCIERSSPTDQHASHSKF